MKRHRAWRGGTAQTFRAHRFFAVCVLSVLAAMLFAGPAFSSTSKTPAKPLTASNLDSWATELNQAISSEEGALTALESGHDNGVLVAKVDLGIAQAHLRTVENDLDALSEIAEIDLGKDVHVALTNDGEAMTSIDDFLQIGSTTKDGASRGATDRDAAENSIKEGILNKKAGLVEIDDLKKSITTTTSTTTATTTTTKITSGNTVTSAPVISSSSGSTVPVEVSVGGSFGPPLKSPYGDDSSTYVWTVLNTSAGSHTVVVHFTGPGLPSSLVFATPTGKPYTKTFVLSACGVWIERVVSVDGHALDAKTNTLTRSLACATKKS